MKHPKALLYLLLMIVSLGSLALGSVSLWSLPSDLLWTILLELRTPRLIISLMVGAALGLSGAVLQGFFRNPLAEAGVLGVSSGAALSCVLALSFFGLSHPLFGVIGAFFTTLLLHSMVKNHLTSLSIILAGVALNSFMGSSISLTLNLSKNPYALLEALFWLMGSLAHMSWDHVLFAAPLIFLGCLLLIKTGPALNALSLGEDVAKSLGVSLKKTYAFMVLGVALSIGASVSISGIIGFIGLVTPHLLRPLVGHKPQSILWPSALGGAILLTLSDTLVRLLAPHGELKLGVLTSFIGAPFFLYILMKSKHDRLS